MFLEILSSEYLFENKKYLCPVKDYYKQVYTYNSWYNSSGISFAMQLYLLISGMCGMRCNTILVAFISVYTVQWT
jgi:hypothetical protein